MKLKQYGMACSRAVALMVAIALATMMWSCRDNDRFTIALKVKGLGQQSVTMTYYADGAVGQLTAHADKEEVLKFVGKASEPALVELSLTSTGMPLAMLVARNGESIKGEMSLADPLSLTVKGSKASEAMAGFLRDNAELIVKDDSRSLNAKIKEYVLDHRNSVASTALVVSMFDLENDAMLADSLMNVIDKGARPFNLIENFNSTLSFRAQNAFKTTVKGMTLVGAKDSIYELQPTKQSYMLLAFTGNDRSRRDSITSAMRRLAKDHRSSWLKVVEVSMLADSSMWRREIRGDSATWDQAWAPGSAASVPIQRLQVVRTPYFIVADSLGRQLYRTVSVTNAARFIADLAD